MAIIRGGYGTGPFSFSPTGGQGGALRLMSEVVTPGDDVSRREEVLLSGASAEQAVKAFAAGKSDLVLGGTFSDLPYARAVKLPRNSLRFDPASGLFGLVPTTADGPVAERDLRRLLSQAIDRDALVAAFNVPGLAARATLLEPGLDGLADPVQPAWYGTSLADRRPAMLAEAARLFGNDDKPTIRVFLGEGPGADVLLGRLTADWGALGFTVERAKTAGADVRKRRRQVVDRHQNLPAEQVREHRPRSPEGHVRDSRARHHLEELRGQVARCAVPRGAGRQLARVRSGERGELLNGIGRH